MYSMTEEADMTFVQLIREQFDFLQLEGFSDLTYKKSGLVEDCVFSSQSYALRVSHDLREGMVSSYLVSTLHRDPRFEGHFLQVDTWRFLKRITGEKPRVPKQNGDSLDQEVQREASIIKEYLPIIKGRAESYFESQSKRSE